MLFNCNLNYNIKLQLKLINLYKKNKLYIWNHIIIGHGWLLILCGFKHLQYDIKAWRDIDVHVLLYFIIFNWLEQLNRFVFNLFKNNHCHKNCSYLFFTWLSVHLCTNFIFLWQDDDKTFQNLYMFRAGKHITVWDLVLITTT